MASRPAQKMPVSERAKQFMPFAALKGLPEALTQVERAHTAKGKKELSEEMAADLNRSLLSLYPGQQVQVIFFRAGHEQRVNGIVSKIDVAFQFLLLDGSLRISFSDLLKVEPM